MKTILITRYTTNENQTLGNCTVLDEHQQPLFSALSLERGWRNNQPNISCIPQGAYPVKLEASARFSKDLWEIKDVPNRSECKFHSANFWRDLNGCIALGSATADIDKDRYLDITNSGDTMERFHKVMENDKEAILVIKNFRM